MGSDATGETRSKLSGLALTILPPADAAPAIPAGQDGVAVEARVVIVGSGPAGLTAAIYAARAGLDPLVLAGVAWGGQLMLTGGVENYPGFPEGIDGPDLMGRMRAQAERFGARVVNADVEKADLGSRPFRLRAGGVGYRADALIVATGAEALWTGVEGEGRLRGRGVSACATCDGFFFRGKAVAVVGGGDTAAEEALYLTRFADRVHLVHRRDSLRASKIMAGRLTSHPKVEMHLGRVVDEITGTDHVEGVRLSAPGGGASEVLAVEGVFVAIGHRPKTEAFREWLPVDAKGYLSALGGTAAGSVEGVFIAGDVDDSRYRQAVTAAGEGARAAIDAERWLEGQQLRAPEARSAGR